MLFNPLNTFLVSEVTEKCENNEKVLNMKLEYGYVAGAIASKSAPSSENTAIAYLASHQRQNKARILYQQHALNSSVDRNLNGIQKYWREYH